MLIFYLQTYWSLWPFDKHQRSDHKNLFATVIFVLIIIVASEYTSVQDDLTWAWWIIEVWPCTYVFYIYIYIMYVSMGIHIMSQTMLSSLLISSLGAIWACEKLVFSDSIKDPRWENFSYSFRVDMIVCLWLIDWLSSRICTPQNCLDV